MHAQLNFIGTLGKVKTLFFNEKIATNDRVSIKNQFQIQGFSKAFQGSFSGKINVLLKYPKFQNGVTISIWHHNLNMALV